MSAVDLLDVLRDGASWAFILAGSFFVVVGAIGLVRLPDFYTRMHAAGLTDTMGAELLLIGLMIQADSVLVVIKLALIILFLFFTSPTSTHAIANAAFIAGQRPWRAPESTDDKPAQTPASQDERL